LYTDDEEVTLDAQRPVILNGIGAIVTRSDLLDRSVLVRHPSISDLHRRTEAEFWESFEVARPRILGALLDGVSVGLRRLPQVRLVQVPRMADFAHFATACSPSFGWDDGAFLAAYSGNRAEAHDVALEDSAIAALVVALADEGFTGTQKDLLARLRTEADEEARRGKDWPSTPRALRSELERIAPNLRTAGVVVTFPRKNERPRNLTIKREAVEPPTAPDPSSSGNGDGPDGSDGHLRPFSSADDLPLATPDEEALFERNQDLFSDWAARR
jgi:hypothetical protein